MDSSIFNITIKRSPSPECSGSDRMIEDGEEELMMNSIGTRTTSFSSSMINLVSPGETIASSKHWMRGHGTFLEEEPQSIDQPTSQNLDGSDDDLKRNFNNHLSDDDDDDDDELDDSESNQPIGMIRSTLVGTVERINKLITVRGLRGRYRPEVGDLVIGRITEVQSKRWKVDAGSRLNAVLMLGSVNLPGGVQRRKLESDELQMRLFFQEGDLLVSEVQAFFGDGSMSLHTRSLKYGKLRNGILVQVPPQLIQRSKSHFHSLPIGIDLIIGVNGWIWISKSSSTTTTTTSNSKDNDQKDGMDEFMNDGFEAVNEDMYSNVNEPISYSNRNKISRISGVINLLSNNCIAISDQSVMRGYEASLEVSESILKNRKRDRLIGQDENQNDYDEDEDEFIVNQFFEDEFKELVLSAIVAH